jgi:2C-methyl-D-erythritol 2,4-cyclodiphosphate synthase
MRRALAGALGVDPDAVSVKGKTNEGMGWIGRGEGVACIAVATLVRDSGLGRVPAEGGRVGSGTA